MAHNGRLERFQFEFGDRIKTANISEQAAREQYQYVDLNPPEGDLALQLSVYDDHVFITIPYWYAGSDADRVFSELSDYLRVMRRTAGFFVYDPQTEIAFDPELNDFRDYSMYDEIVRDLPNILSGTVGIPKKPWWKLW
jgi:hypothetical protein